MNLHFRHLLNKDRRFIPLRLDDTSIKDPLAQFLYINWLPADGEPEYAKLLEACQPPAQQTAAGAENCIISESVHRRATLHRLGVIEATCLNELIAM